MKTEKFLEYFPGHQVFAAFPDDNSTSPPRHYHEEYEASIDVLRKINNHKKWGVFFTVNLLDRSLDPTNEATGRPRHRTKKMVTKCRAVFMDADDPQSAPLTSFPLSPSLVVESSKGKYHYYWLIEDGTDDFETWQLVQNGIINKYNGDPKAKDLTRVLRIPGYYHNKDQDNPFMCKVLTADDRVEVYSWDKIVDSFPPDTEVHVKETGSISSGESKTLDQHQQDLHDGKDFHGTLTSLVHQMKKDGILDQYIIMSLQGMMHNVPEENRGSQQRWQMRFDDIERDVTNYTPPVVEMDIPEAAVEEIDVGEMPWPPGLFGQLASDAYGMARYQYREVAIISSLGLVAGICGRKFNVDNTGLNIYATLIMDTGMGKDSITDFINRALTSCNDIGTGMNFLGPVRFTGPKAVYKSLAKKRSQVCVFTEAGLLLNSKAGDGDGLKRMLLGLFNKSGQYSFSGQEQYSSDDDDVKPLRAPALTIINESTPAMLLQVFQKSNSIESGEVPRQLIYRIMGDKPTANTYGYKSNITADCLDKLKHILSKCNPVQEQEDPKAWNLEPTDEVRADMIKTEQHYVEVQNENRRVNSTKYAMATRAFYKAVRLAGITSVFNHNEPKIDMPEWQWAKEMIEFELRGLEMFFRGGGMGDSLSDVSMRVVGNKILDILNDKISIRDGQSKKHHKAGFFGKSELTQALKNQKEVTALSDSAELRSTPIMGIEKCIAYLIRSDMIYADKPPGVKAFCYKVTDSFLASFE